MTSAFSTNDTECLSREIEQNYDVKEFKQIWSESRLDECSRWIQKNNFTKVCLQFPDELIGFSVQILTDLKRITTAELCILGDTSYGSCCVDEVAAAHFNANAIIHFGHACLSKVARLPVLYIFSHFKFDLMKFQNNFIEKFPSKHENVLIFYADEYFYELDNIKNVLNTYERLDFAELALNSSADKLCWKLPTENIDEKICIYLGPENLSFFNLTLALKVKEWISYDPQINQTFKTVSSPLATNWMRRRNYFVEKCKDAQSLGIVIGTLTTVGYLDIVNRIQALARQKGVRSYMLSVGKVNPAKLGNFMEIDCFVFIGCPENNIYTSRDFYKPLLSVFEVELALNPAWHSQYPDYYCTDYKEILPNGEHYRAIVENNDIEEYDVSLVTGRARKIRQNNEVTSENTNGAIEKKCNQLMDSTSTSTFQERSWTGLDPSLGQQEPSKIVKGRSGIPIEYTD